MSEEELKKLFVHAGVPIHGHTLNHIFFALDESKGKSVDFEELMKVLELENGKHDEEADYKQIFKLYDRKNRGFFEYEDYRLVGEGVAKYLTEG
jgi:Ca2+-binding EF-hand superfamily protein